MGRIIGTRIWREGLLCFGLLIAALSLILWPDQAMEAMKDGLSLCGNVILPSLFPFFVLSSLVVELGMSRYLGRMLAPIMIPLFRVNGSCAAALALGFIGGYPVGARTAIQLYESGQCSRTETERLLAFCNNCGPAFILGVVGTGIFQSGRVGFLLYLAHLLASLIVGLLFRFYKAEDRPTHARRAAPQFQTARFSVAFTHSVTGALQSTLNICAFILFFTVVIRITSYSGALSALSVFISHLLAPLGLSQVWVQQLLIGLLEVSSGVSSITDGTMTGRVSMAAFMLGWAGVSVHCQVLAFLGESGLSMRTYLAGKLLHGGLSALLVTRLSRFLLPEEVVYTYLSEQTATIAQLDFHQTLTISAVCAWTVWLLLFALVAYAAKKSSGKSARYAL